jgi:hypothetical protein
MKEQNKKDNPKEIFYEFFKLFRKQKKNIFSSSSAELFLLNSKIFFAQNDTLNIKNLYFFPIKNFSSELQK